MEREIEKLHQKFLKIKAKGWIKTVVEGNNGVGITIENLLHIQKNELEIPDYEGIEIKAKRNLSNSYITLFSCKPEGKYYHEVERIKDTYGYPHKTLSQYKVLNNSVYSNIKNKIGNRFYFQLKVCRVKQKIILMIYNLKGELLEDDVYWDFDILKEKLERKLSVLAFIKAYSKKSKIDRDEYFKYNSIEFYFLKNFDTFINCIEHGIIRVNFKLNIRTSGNNIGKIHDHGTSFDILERDIPKLYKKYDL